MRQTLLIGLILGACPVSVMSADWPMWRYDAGRSAVSPQELADELHLRWQRDLPANHVAWAEDPPLQFDAQCEPIVIGKTILVASSANDSVTAYDTDTGEEQWQFFAGGPIRSVPVGWRKRVYFGADDGYFYCVDVANGQLVWKLPAAPTGRRVLGNERLISIWPVRGGPVLYEGKLYFTAGVWPFEGTFLYTMDLRSPSQTVPQFSVRTLSDISPQGCLALSGERLFIPGGRTTATCIDVNTGQPLSLRYGPQGPGDYHVASAGELFFHGAKVYHLGLHRSMPFDAPRPVSDGNTVYCRGEGKLLAYDMSKHETFIGADEKGQEVERDRVPVSWELATSEICASDQPPQVHMKAGRRLYGSCGNTLFAVEGGDEPRVAWKRAIEGQAGTMLAADGKLFVVTRQGRMYCFSQQQVEATVYPLAHSQWPAINDQWTERTAQLLRHAASPRGYCLVLGIGSGRLIAELVRQSDLQIIVVDPDPDAVRELRHGADALGLYGKRWSAIVGDPESIDLPPYLATLVVCEHDGPFDFADGASVSRIFQSLRPYGGAAVFELADDQFPRLQASLAALDLPNAELAHGDGLAVLKRVGALPGAADWTHEYSDAANTLMSADDLTKAPLGVLWYGGPAGSGELYFNRHYWGPGPIIAEGRMFVQGPQLLTAIDIYTGLVLWKKELREGSSPGRGGSFFEAHKPGFHFVAAGDYAYLVYPDVCVRLDPATGESLSHLKLASEQDQWGKVRVWKDLLVVTVFREHEELGLLPQAIKAVNRHSGEEVWSTEASYSAPLLAVGGEKVFFFDGMLEHIYDAWKRKGLVPNNPAGRLLRALDVNTGEQLWQAESPRVATWLAYAQQQDVLVVSNKRGFDALRGDNGETLWQKNEEAPGFGGHPENVWDKVIVAGDLIIDQRGPGQAFDLATGTPVADVHPITGEPTPWRFTKTGHHCNYAIASRHLLTFRAHTAGFFDRRTMGTARLLGFRSACRNSLIPAGGVLNAPNYAHGCVCSFNIFTSLAFVHRPDAELWTYNAYATPQSQPKRFGINLGAPGDRLADNGTLWVEYPRASEPSATIEVKVEGESLRWFHQHSIEIEGPGLKWVGASGVQGVSGLKILLPGGKNEEGDYTVRLVFCEPDQVDAGTRVFDVAVQGRVVLSALDIVKRVGGPKRLLDIELPNIKARDDINLTFSALRGQALICGVEIIAKTPR